MNPKHLAWIAIAVVVLIVLWGLARLLPSRSDRLTGDFHLTPVAVDSADSVVIASVGDTVRLARLGPAHWTVNGFQAANNPVVELFQALQDTAPPELVAHRASSFARLGVDTVGGRRLRVVRGAHAVVDLLVSERGPDFQSAYVRVPGDSAVYALGGGLASVVRKRPDDWRDRTVAGVTVDSVREVELTRGPRHQTLRKTDGGWRMADGHAADSNAVTSLLAHYRTITAGAFPTRVQLDSAFRSRIERRATLRGADRQPLLDLEFDSSTGGYWMRRVGAPRDSTVRMNAWDVDLLFPADSTLRKGKP